LHWGLCGLITHRQCTHLALPIHGYIVGGSGITEVYLNGSITTSPNKVTEIHYTYADNGTNAYLYLSFIEQP